MGTTIEVHHLTKDYGGFTALHDISFTVEQGEVMCLLGPNGAGKTTTTEILEGYRDRTSGAVRVLGFDPGRHERAFRARIGIVLQECGVQDDLTVGEVLDMYGSYAPRRLATADVLRLVELDAKTGDRVRHLSGGQRRRLDVGLALVGDPDLIFLDEPTTGFDPAARRASWSMIRSLTALGKTVLLTTHFMDEAQALADRIAVVAGGRIIAEGTPETLGGRDRGHTVVEATLPDGVTAERLPDFGDAMVELNDRALRIETSDGVRDANTLTGWSLSTGMTLGRLTVHQPSLEDIYLTLTDPNALETAR
ncbi:MAG: ABC transporter ATP-binding protein [Ilumatobacteraceae bacterium]